VGFIVYEDSYIHCSEVVLEVGGVKGVFRMFTTSLYIIHFNPLKRRDEIFQCKMNYD
jgi:hypothetical protein